jgi:hypothetical protein
MYPNQPKIIHPDAMSSYKFYIHTCGTCHKQWPTYDVQYSIIPKLGFQRVPQLGKCGQCIVVEQAEAKRLMAVQMSRYTGVEIDLFLAEGGYTASEKPLPSVEATEEPEERHQPPSPADVEMRSRSASPPNSGTTDVEMKSRSPSPAGLNIKDDKASSSTAGGCKFGFVETEGTVSASLMLNKVSGHGGLGSNSRLHVALLPFNCMGIYGFGLLRAYIRR